MLLPYLLPECVKGDHSVSLPHQSRIPYCPTQVEEEGAMGQYALAKSQNSASQLLAAALVRRRSVFRSGVTAHLKSAGTHLWNPYIAMRHLTLPSGFFFLSAHVVLVGRSCARHVARLRSQEGFGEVRREELFRVKGAVLRLPFVS